MQKKQLIRCRVYDTRGNELVAIPYRESKTVRIVLSTEDGNPIVEKVVRVTINTARSPNARFLTAGQHPELSIEPCTNIRGEILLNLGFEHFDRRRTFTFVIEVFKILGEMDEQFRPGAVSLKIAYKAKQVGDENVFDPPTSPSDLPPPLRQPRLIPRHVASVTPARAGFQHGSAGKVLHFGVGDDRVNVSPSTTLSAVPAAVVDAAVEAATTSEAPTSEPTPGEPMPEIAADAMLPVVDEPELPPIQMREISTPPAGDSQPSFPTFVHVDCPRCRIHYRVSRLDLMHTNRLAQCRRCGVRFKISIDGTCTEEPIPYIASGEDDIDFTPSEPPPPRRHLGQATSWMFVGFALVVLMIGWMMGKANQSPTAQAVANDNVAVTVEDSAPPAMEPVVMAPTTTQPPPPPEPPNPLPATVQKPPEVWVPLTQQAVPLHPPNYYKVGAKPGKK